MSIFRNFKKTASQFEVEAAEWSFYLSYLRGGMVAFDLGGYLGELTLLFSRFVREAGRVHTFEASSATFERLQQICQLSGASNVALNNVAVTDRPGEVGFNVYDKDFLSWSSLAQRPLEKYGINVKPVKVEKVEATTIDAYCEKHGIEKIDLLKIDVEGAEYQVMRGAQRMFEQKRIRCCTFEFGQTTFDMGNSPDQIAKFFKDAGYRVKNLVGGDPVFPGGKSCETANFSMHVATPGLL